MRKLLTLSSVIVALAGVILLLEVGEAAAQQDPGKGFGGKGFGGKGFGGKGFMMQVDPGQIFDQYMAKGRDHFPISEARMGKAELEYFAKQNNITDGKLTREMFLKYWEQKDKIREEVRKSSGGDAPPEGGKGGKGGKDGKRWNFDPEAMFKDYDTNGDGFLNEDEIGQTRGKFKDEWHKWDKNKDGKISLDEWKDYWAARQKEWAERKGGDKKGDDKKKEEPIDRQEYQEVDNTVEPVWHRDKLPEGLPPWFKELDKNNDGQVSLAEWMKAGKPLTEFAKYDLNDDGLLTPEEVYRVVRPATKAGSSERDPLVANGPPPTNPRIGAGGPFGRQGGPFGKGGNKGGRKGGWGGGKGGFGGKKGGFGTPPGPSGQ
jgi:Ca2+-binding EF-hand superfamily protein